MVTVVVAVTVTAAVVTVAHFWSAAALSRCWSGTSGRTDLVSAILVMLSLGSSGSAINMPATGRVARPSGHSGLPAARRCLGRCLGRCRRPHCAGGS